MTHKTPQALLVAAALLFSMSAFAQQEQKPAGGADEMTPSKSEYFSWINHTWEGASESQTMANLAFFRWLHDSYGMTLDIYAMDAGTIDGWEIYDKIGSDRQKKLFPNSFGAVSKYAGEMGTRLGMWCGPDGFGDTDREAKEREEMMVSLVRDFHFTLFKMDACCGKLRPEKYQEFDHMMTKVREYDPELVLLNHRLELGPGTRHSTTFLLGGAETYVDIHMANRVTAPHHRVENISRETPEGLTRLTEDHGVCLSSCLDFWEDDLILQAFGRELILAPEIYANPWLLRDDEFPQLAYIYNLHRRYRDILPQAIKLDETQYGPEALSRGSDHTRFITLRNLSWNPVKYTVKLGEETGLRAKSGEKVQVRLYHPYIYDMGKHGYGEEIEVEVLPFRAALVKITTEKERDPLLVSGIPYQIVKDSDPKDQQVKLLGWPGETYRVSINGKKAQKITFPGTAWNHDYHRKISSMEKVDMPADAETLYEATCFAADDNALEVQSLKRSGETAIPQVQAARDAFFNQQTFIDRDVWDRYLFDGDPATGYAIAKRWGDQRVDEESGLYIDLGKPTELDQMVLVAANVYDLSPLRPDEGLKVQASADLKSWTTIQTRSNTRTTVDLSKAGAVRYLKLPKAPLRLIEIEAYKDGKEVSYDGWKVNNLFRLGSSLDFQQAWKSEFTLDEVPAGSYLCIAVEGKHGWEGAWAAVKVDGEYVGCPDRAPSYKSNTWECPVRNRSYNYTYYVPVTPDMKGKTIEAYVLGTNDSELKPEIWITAYPVPFDAKTVSL